LRPARPRAGRGRERGLAAAAAATAAAARGRRGCGSGGGGAAGAADGGEGGEQFDGVLVACRTARGLAGTGHRTIDLERVAALATPETVVRHGPRLAGRACRR